MKRNDDRSQTVLEGSEVDFHQRNEGRRWECTGV